MFKINFPSITILQLNHITSCKTLFQPSGGLNQKDITNSVLAASKTQMNFQVCSQQNHCDMVEFAEKGKTFFGTLDEYFPITLIKTSLDSSTLFKQRLPLK